MACLKLNMGSMVYYRGVRCRAESVDDDERYGFCWLVDNDGDTYLVPRRHPVVSGMWMSGFAGGYPFERRCYYAGASLSRQGQRSLPEPVCRARSPRTSVWSGFQVEALLLLFYRSRNLSELAGFKAHNHSSLHMQMAGRNTWCHPTRERGLEQCFPALKYVTCLQSLPWPKS